MSPQPIAEVACSCREDTCQAKISFEPDEGMLIWTSPIGVHASIHVDANAAVMLIQSLRAYLLELTVQ